MPPDPPYDRTIALACTLPALRHRWLYARCQCGSIHQHPINLTLIQKPGGRAVDAGGPGGADAVQAVPRAGDDGAAGRGSSDPREVRENPTAGPIPGWSLVLHGLMG